MKFSIWLLVKGTLIALLFIMTACSDASDPHTPKIVKDDSTPPPKIALTVFKSRTCGCCQKWITHAEDNGFDITANDVTFLSDLKEDKGIAPNYRSCHTAESKEGYVFEGHWLVSACNACWFAWNGNGRAFYALPNTPFACQRQFNSICGSGDL